MERTQIEREAIARFIHERFREGAELYLVRGGRVFEITGYDHAANKFKVKPAERIGREEPRIQ